MSSDANASANSSLADWPVDVQRTTESGEVDLGQLEFNLSLTPTERIVQNDQWVAFLALVRNGKRQDDRPASA